MNKKYEKYPQESSRMVDFVFKTWTFLFFHSSLNLRIKIKISEKKPLLFEIWRDTFQDSFVSEFNLNERLNKKKLFLFETWRDTFQDSFVSEFNLNELLNKKTPFRLASLIVYMILIFCPNKFDHVSVEAVTYVS